MGIFAVSGVVHGKLEVFGPQVNETGEVFPVNETSSS